MSAPAARPDPWSGFVLDPRLPQHSALRASDQDRSAVHQLLSEAYAEGRLDRDELDERASTADGLKTYGEIPALVGDLVPLEPARHGVVELARWSPDDIRREASRKYDDERRAAVLTFLGPTLICWAVWVATAFGDGEFEMQFPWPLIVMAATLVHLVQVLVRRRERTEAHVREIERQRSKALKKAKRRPPLLG